jgi:hypothetical protein
VVARYVGQPAAFPAGVTETSCRFMLKKGRPKIQAAFFLAYEKSISKPALESRTGKTWEKGYDHHTINTL